MVWLPNIWLSLIGQTNLSEFDVVRLPNPIKINSGIEVSLGLIMEHLIDFNTLSINYMYWLHEVSIDNFAVHFIKIM